VVGFPISGKLELEGHTRWGKEGEKRVGAYKFGNFAGDE
jgi:hypothetical protein